jgi:hypothetical protein
MPIHVGSTVAVFSVTMGNKFNINEKNMNLFIDGLATEALVDVGIGMGIVVHEMIGWKVVLRHLDEIEQVLGATWEPGPDLALDPSKNLLDGVEKGRIGGQE